MKNLWILVLIGCAHPRPPVSAVAAAATLQCDTARSFGAIPDDNVDDRAPLQAALIACGGTPDHPGKVQLEVGTYDVVTMPRPTGRPYAMLSGFDNVELVGRGPTQTTIRFSGDNGKRDWWGIQPGSHVVIREMRWVSDFVAGSTVEQTHIVRWMGPATDLRIGDIACYHPQNGSKSGDCLQVVCYDPLPDGTGNKQCWDLDVGYTDFENTGRSGIAVHSGLHGRLKPDGHWSTRFHDLHFGNISDQPIDGEGSGGTSGVEIDHIVADFPSNLESSFAFDFQGWTDVHVHDNQLNGRGVNAYGCSLCFFEHNVITQNTPNSPAVDLRKKSSDVRFISETYTRTENALVGPVVSVSQKLGAPDHVLFDHVKFTQRTNFPIISTIGLVGLVVTDSRLLYEGPYIDQSRADALSFIGSGSVLDPSCTDNLVPSDNPGVRTTDLHVLNNVIAGNYRATAIVSGSYCGTGYLEMSGNVVTGPKQGLRCENMAVGSGVVGPIILQNNSMPQSFCQPLAQ